MNGFVSRNGFLGKAKHLIGKKPYRVCPSESKRRDIESECYNLSLCFTS